MDGNGGYKQRIGDVNLTLRGNFTYSKRCIRDRFNADADLFGNWIGVGAFYPFSRGHACAGTNNKEPWAFGQEVENAARIALERRYILLPYYYTLLHEASTNGMPIMRPVFFADPKDLSLRAEEEAFLIGNNPVSYTHLI